MIQCLLDISSNTGDDLDCEEWVNMVNRGRLWQRMKTCTVSFVGWKNLLCGVDTELSEVLPKHIAELYLTVRLMHSPVLIMNYLRRPVNELYQNITV